MRRLIKSIAIIMMALILIPAFIMASNYRSLRGIVFIKIENPMLNNIPDDDDENECRAPILTIGSISEERGICIASLDNDDITACEIYDSGNCIASFNDEMNFVYSLFNMSGEFDIIIYTDDFTYKGSVYL